MNISITIGEAIRPQKNLVDEKLGKIVALLATLLSRVDSAEDSRWTHLRLVVSYDEKWMEADKAIHEGGKWADDHVMIDAWFENKKTEHHHWMRISFWEDLVKSNYNNSKLSNGSVEELIGLFVKELAADF